MGKEFVNQIEVLVDIVDKGTYKEYKFCSDMLKVWREKKK